MRPTLNRLKARIMKEKKKSKLKKIPEFIRKVIVGTKNNLVGFFKGLFHHAESVVILTLASLGLNALLSELPFYLSIPMWVEATMIIPVLSVIGIMLLMIIAIYRHNDEVAAAAA